jgi:hypothetical protein
MNWMTPRKSRPPLSLNKPAATFFVALLSWKNLKKIKVQLVTDITARMASTILITREEWLTMKTRSILTISASPPFFDPH